MNRKHVVTSFVAALLAGGSALSCFGDRTSVLEPIGPPAYNGSVSVTLRGLPRGAVSTTVFTNPPDDSAVVVSLAGLEELSGAFYKVWLADSTAANFTPAAGRVIHVQVDTVQGSAGDSAVTTADTTTLGPAIALRGGDGGTSDTVRILQSQVGSNPRAGNFHFVVVSIETDSLAATPSSARPLWLRYRAPGATGALRFGNFDQDATLAFLFTPVGSGSAGYRGDIEMQADLFQLARPPIGYYYRAWLVTQTGSQVTSYAELGPLLAPYPRSGRDLDEADVQQVDEVVLPRSIYQSRVRAMREDLTVQPGASTPASFGVFSFISITLEPKQGLTTMGPTQILAGNVPEAVQ